MALLASDPGGEMAIVAAPSIWAQLTDHTGSPRTQASRLIALLFPPEVAPVIDRDFGGLVARAREALCAQTLAAQERAIAAWHEHDRPEIPEPAPHVLAE